MAEVFGMLFYMPSFSGGGAERNSVLIANELSRRGHLVFIAVDKNAGPNKSLLSDKINVEEVSGNSHAAHITSLRKILRRIQPDIVFARVGLSNIKILLAASGVIPRQHIVISYENLYDPLGRCGGRLTYQLSSILTRIAGATIAVSSDVKLELVNWFKARKKNIHVVHNPVDLQWVRKRALSGKPSWLKGKSYILSAGRMVHQKDYPTLLRAFAEVSDKIDQDLIILGDGPLRKELEQLAAYLGIIDRVHMPGYITNPFPVYKGADVFVLSSVFEGFGNVLIEALALGIPVVATNCPGGPKEILENGKYGKLVSLANPKALAAAILATLLDPPEAEFLKKRGKHFAVDRIVDAYLRIAELGNDTEINPGGTAAHSH